MKILRFLTSLLVLLVSLGVSAGAWQSDAAATDSTFERRTVVQPDDYSGRVVSTIIRKMTPQPSDRGVLYIHGFNDYFFNVEMADVFVGHGYNFYAVDLRKYGRSLLPGQKRFQVRNLDEYFPDIDSALVDMRRAGIREIVLMGHSTGGLIAALFMAKAPDAKMVDVLILNSPFLDWNLGSKEKFVPLVAAIGKIFPNLPISQGDSKAYAESLLKQYHGRWNYNTTWKLPVSPDVDAGWVRAIDMAQKELRDGRADIRVPILLMYSAHSVSGDDWTPEFERADCVLDVSDIRRYGLQLGPRVTCFKVVGGLHDLMLSPTPVTRALYPRIFTWLSTTLPKTNN